MSGYYPKKYFSQKNIIMDYSERIHMSEFGLSELSDRNTLLSARYQDRTSV